MVVEHEDYMCPNCVTPWKCNGPHLTEESQVTKEDKAVEKVVRKIINNGTGDDLVAAVLETSLDSIVEDLVELTQKFPLEGYQAQDFSDHIENGRALVGALQYYTSDSYSDISSYLDACADLVEKPEKVSLELEEAIVCAKLGVEMILHCEMSGVPIKEIPELIRLRGEYLKQEPEPKLKENLTQDTFDSPRRKHMAAMDDKKDNE